MTHFDPVTGEEIVKTAVIGRPQESGHAVFDFVKYNNAFPIFLWLLLFSGGGALAATNPEIQAAVVSKTETVRSVDNTYITSVNLNSYEPKVKVTSITQDGDTYYVAYDLYTIDLADDGVWKILTKKNILKVSKQALAGGDLGLYVEKELAQITDHELVRLKETQAIERSRGVSQKSIATAYGGIIGKFISPSEETFPGYNPVIDAPPLPQTSVPEQITTLVAAESLSVVVGSSTSSTTERSVPHINTVTVSSSTPPITGTSTPPQAPPEEVPPPETPPTDSAPAPEPSPTPDLTPEDVPNP